MAGGRISKADRAGGLKPRALLRSLDLSARIPCAWRRRWAYRKTWRTPVGRDCISLDASLCDWLAERLAFLSRHHNSFPADSTSEEWAMELLTHAMSFAVYSEHWNSKTADHEERIIAQAQESLRWIADNLPGLWD